MLQNKQAAQVVRPAVWVMIILLFGLACSLPACGQLLLTGGSKEPGSQSPSSSEGSDTESGWPPNLPLFIWVQPGSFTPTPFQPDLVHADSITSDLVPDATASPPTPALEATLVEELPQATAAPLPILSGQETINFLLIGSDSRGGIYFRTDTLIIASVRPKDALVTLISIPRDLYVAIPTYGNDRINTAYLRGELTKYTGGGEALLKDTIAHNLGITIDHIALVDFNGFRQIVDELDGIDVPVACSFTDWRIIDPDVSDQLTSNWELFTVDPGVVHMDGDMALWYARSRLRSSDFDRGRRQQEVLRSIYRRALDLELILKIPEIYKEFKDIVKTDLKLKTLLALSPLAFNVTNARIRSFYIRYPAVNSWITPGGGYVLVPQTKEMEALIEEAMSPPAALEEKQMRTVVEVLNRTYREDWSSLAAERLEYAGFRVVILSPEPKSGKTTLLVDLNAASLKDKTASSPNVRSVLLSLFGLQESDLRFEPQESSDAHFRLVIGDDFKPCFNPGAIHP